MPALPLAQAYASLDQYGEPARLINMYVEAAETTSGMALRPRPGLELRYTLGDGPVRAQAYSEGSVGAAVYAISGSGAYKDQTLLGTMSGSTGATIASSGDEVVFTLGGSAWVYNGTTLTEVTDPDLPDVSAVIFIAGRFFYQVADSDTWYYSGIYNAASIDGLAFATAEALPDATRGVAVINNEAWFFGTQSVEPFYPTGDADAPLQSAVGRMIPKGCASQQTICALDNTLFWLGNNGQVYRASNVAKAVSTPAIADKIGKTADITACTAFTTTFGAHEFYVLTVPDQGTFAYDVATGQWSQWDTYGETTFRVLSAAQRDTDAYLGDATTGKVYGWSEAANTDNGSVITRLFPAYLPTETRGVPNFNVALQGTSGQGLNLSDHAAIQMRYSDDGRTWSQWLSRSLGAIGDYGHPIVWWRLGQIGAKGRRFEFRLTDAVTFAASGMTFNEHRP